MANRRKIRLLAVISIILVILFVTWGLKSSNWGYFLSKRIPKIMAIVLTGGAIGFSSLIFQTATNNRILTPSVLGLDSLYMVIQSVAIFLLGSTSKLIVNKNINFAMTVVLMIVFSRILFRSILKKGNNNILTLLLMGLILGTFFQSFTSFIQMMIDPNEFLHIQDKMFASFNNVNTEILMISSAIILLIGFYSRKYLGIWDVLALGRDNAINLGIDYDKIIKTTFTIVSILVSISTALVGPITFLGLLVVNLAREFLDTYEHKFLIVTSMLIAVVALVGGQLLTERIFNFGTPISVIINFIGGIYFIHLLLKEGVS
ncbi:MAG: iron chelate uptake ABC transporter family permease subunit [Tissierellaceae bacterium]|nr:iron chelate uptake ABC transporter family permease subunit [Tissierellaceae bacterium]